VSNDLIVNVTTAEMLDCLYYKDVKIVRHTEISHKCCKDVVKTDSKYRTNKRPVESRFSH
jgi:hypothetical protein